MLFSLTVSAEYKEIVQVLKYVESYNNPSAIGDGGDSWGVLQIQKPAVDDVNRYFGTHYQHEDMFNEACAEEVAILYMRMGAELYKKRHGVEASEEVLVRNHNGGIYRGYRYRATKKYYRTYLEWKDRINKGNHDVIKAAVIDTQPVVLKSNLLTVN